MAVGSVVSASARWAGNSAISLITLVTLVAPVTTILQHTTLCGGAVYSAGVLHQDRVSGCIISNRKAFAGNEVQRRALARYLCAIKRDGADVVHTHLLCRDRTIRNVHCVWAGSELGVGLHFGAINDNRKPHSAIHRRKCLL